MKNHGFSLLIGDGERRSGEFRNEDALESGGGDARLARAAERLDDTLDRMGVGPGELGPEPRFQPWPE